MSKIDEIKQSVDIIDIIQEYVDLTKKGKNFWGVCPFHDDSNPSMSVSQDKQMYNCFSCGNAGGVFKFVQQIEKVNFKKAVNIVGKNIGMSIDTYEKTSEYNKNQKKVIEVLRDAMDYYQLAIDAKDGLKALEYANQRGLDAHIREVFNIGYAPNIDLISFLKEKKGYDEAVLINASLTNSIGKSFFRERLMFGIANEFGEIIALSGRALKNDEVKYINSAESMVFKKSNVLYNWNKAKKEATKEKEVIIVEGFMDVIALYKVGIKNVVAIMGTALTSENANKLYGLTVNLMFDNDLPGINATIKSIKLLQDKNINVNIINNIDQKDVDEILNNEGKEKVIEVIKNKESALQYIYNLHKKKYNSNSPLEIQKMIESFKKYLLKADNFNKDFFANQIQKEYGISKEIILKEIKIPTQTRQEFLNQKHYYKKRDNSYSESLTLTDNNNINIDFNKHSYKLIRSLIYSKPLCQYYETKVNGVNFIDHSLKNIAWSIQEYQLHGTKIPKRIIEKVKNEIKLEGEVATNNEELDDLINKINIMKKIHDNKKLKKNLK